MDKKIVLEEGMSYTHMVVEDVLYIFNPWNGELWITLRGMYKELIDAMMKGLNAGTRHVYSRWVWYGSHGVHVAIVK